MKPKDWKKAADEIRNNAGFLNADSDRFSLMLTCGMKVSCNNNLDAVFALAERIAKGITPSKIKRTAVRL